MMKFFARSIVGLTISHLAVSVAIIQPAVSENQPGLLYPIGSGGSFAKSAGRLFDLDGTAGHFAGTLYLLLPQRSANWYRLQCLVACSSSK